VPTISIDYTEAGYNSAGLNGGFMYIANNAGIAPATGNASISITDLDAYSNYASSGKGGAVYIENGNDAKITINRSGFDGNWATQGSGVWIDHSSDVTITNSTFASNFGSALYLGYGKLSINFATFAYNTSLGGASTIELDASQASEFSLTNSIIYDNATSTISLGDLTTVKVSSRNLFRDVTGFSGPALYGSSYSAITAYGTEISANVLDSNSNIVGYDANTINFINTYSYMASGMAYHANYRTRALAITSEKSLAYQYILNGSVVRPGNNSTNLTTDQRGNSRTGYTYNTTTGKYELNSAPSIGAFEPMFYITVNDKGDMSYDPFNVIVMGTPAANAWFADAIAEDDSLNLREASYWIDSYNPNTDPFNANRYVKFDSNVFTANGDNTISLNSEAGPIEIYTSQIISMVPGYNGQDFETDHTFRAQDDSSRITVDASGTNTRVFTILDSKNPNINVGINNLNITGGTTTNYIKDADAGRGGGIYNNANLTLNNVVVTENSAANSSLKESESGAGGGIFTIDGTLTINDSTISNNTVTGTKISDNTYWVGLGGGIFNVRSTVTINRSLITENTANGYTVDPEKFPSALAGLGGGIFSFSGDMILNNNTITANTLGDSTRNTGSAVYVKGGNFTASHNTIVDNSLPTVSLDTAYSATAGAVYLNGTGNATLYNNIFANNNANGTAGFRGRDIYTSSSINITESNNIVGYYTGSHDFSAGTGNIIGDGFGNVSNLNLDSTLRYNGGKTMNFRVLSNSVATPAGTAAGSNDYDQRGYLREAGVASTIGSYEMTTAITLVTNAETTIDYTNPSIGFDFTNNRAGWEASLRNAAYLADDNSTITIAPSDHQDEKTGVYDVWTRTDGVLDPIYVTNEAIRIVNGVSITTENELVITIDGGTEVEQDGTLTGGVRLFWIDSLSSGLANVSMTNLILQKGNALTDSSNMNGGAIYNTENLTLNNVKVISNHAQNGGGIYSTNGTLTLANDTLIDTQKTLIDSNKAVKGGGIYVDAGNLTISGELSLEGVYEFVKISNNTATDSGAGLYASHATVNMDLADISNNTAQDSEVDPTLGHGGGMYLVNSALTMTQSQITSNSAAFDAGGLYQNGGSASISSSTFSANTAGRYGGGLRVSAQTFEMINSTIANNTSGAYGGGLYLTGSGSHDLTFVTIVYNTSGTATDATQVDGGGIFIAGGSLTMTNNVIANNYHVSVDDANRDEFYTTSMNWITSATHNAIGVSSVGGSVLDFHAVSDTNISNTSHTDFYSDLLMDTELRNNGGATKTIYVWNNSLLVNSEGLYLADITTSQNGKDRANPPTIGAYENNPASDTYYFVGGVGADVTDLENWNSVASATAGPDAGNPDSFSIVDGLYIFDDFGTATAALSAGAWVIGSRSTVEIADGASFTVNGTGSIAVNPMANGEVQTNFTVSDSGALDISVADAAFYTPVSLTVGTSSTTTYSYAGNQTVYNKTYGNLTISGSGTKAASGTISVTANLVLNSASSTFDVAESLTVTGITSGTGNINSTSGTINFDGAVNLTGSTVSAATVNTTGIVTVNDSTITGTTALNVNNNVIAEGGTTSTLSSPGFNFDETNNTITVNDASTQLTFDVGAQDINYYGTGGTAGSNFNVDVTKVAIDNASGRFEVSTTGDISINNIVTGDDSGVQGTLVFTGDVISISDNVVFSTAGVELNNTSNMNIGGVFTVQQDLTITGPVTLTANAFLTSTAGDLALTGTVTGTGKDLSLTATAGKVTTGTFNNIGALVINANTVDVGNNITATSINVTGDATLNGNSTLTSSGAVTFNDAVSLASGADAKLIGDTISLDGEVSGAGDLTLEATGSADSDLALIDMTGNLSLSDGTFTANDAISSANLDIASLAKLTMDTQTLTISGNLTNAGELDSNGIVAVGGNINDTGVMNVANLVLTGSTGVGESVTEICFTDGTTFTTFTVQADKQVKLTDGNIEVGTFNFTADASPTSTFELASGTSVDVTGTTNYNTALYTGNYFITSDGGQLIQTMTGSDVEYRVGISSNDSAIVITLDALHGEKIAVSVLDGVKIRGHLVTGIEETVKFTTVIDRNIGGTSFTNDIAVDMDWATSIEGVKFNQPGDTVDLYTFEDGDWTSLIETLSISSSGGRSTTDYVLPHNGTYTIANHGADMTIPPLPMNVNIYEMANAHFLPMYVDLDTNVFLDFPMGMYPYFSSDRWVTPENMLSVGQSVYRQMEYRLTTDPQTNPLNGQVPPVGAVLDQAITEGASLTLTSDAPVYLEVNGEYSVGENWLPITEPASVENIEQYQEPITQGQIDQFYLDFGGREDIFEKPVSFKSDLDEMLDDLLAG